MNNRTTLSKTELRVIFGISSRKLTTYLNKDKYEDLKLLGYHKNMKLLPEVIVKYFLKDWNYENSINYLKEIYPFSKT